ncbi:VOC family protein [Nocardia sp. NPDC057227]|uniref:VOC family protein n=1 Tax=Nocardia sp. NPDC057227 TaxID=3346056 RepID=UPI003633A675
MTNTPSTDPTPAGVAPVASWIISRDTEAELEFLAGVFGATERHGSRVMNGAMINHVEIELSGGSLMLFDAAPEWPPTPAHTRVYVPDLAAAVRAARERGARIVTEPAAMPFGDAIARFRDPQGHLWWAHERVEDVDADEMMRRFALPEYVAALGYVGETLAAEMARGQS